MNGFIVGTGRCGTTMLASILNTHSQICVPPETQLLFQYAANGVRLHEVFEAGAHFGAAADQFIQLVQQRCPHNLQAFFDYPGYFRSLKYPVTDLKELMVGFYQEMARAHGKAIAIEQTPWYGQRIDLLNDLFPHAKYIHMVRDGRDVAISFARTPWWHKNIEHNMLRWASETGKIARSCALMLDPSQVMVVRYEDFVAAPENELKRICDFFEVQYEDAMMDPQQNVDYQDFDKSNTAAISSATMNEWATKKTTAVFTGSTEAWKSFAGYDFASMPAQARERLLDFGYAA